MPTEFFPPSPPTIVAPAAKHTATIIFLHGFGGSASDWLPVVDAMKHALPHVKWILPNAPQRCATVSLGKLRPAWFNIFSFDSDDAREDREGLVDSVRTIDGYIQEEVEGGIPAERIVVCGFSQGGATSLAVGLTQLGGGWKLGGVATLSSWLPLGRFREVALPHLGEVPVLLCHNKGDPTIAYAWAQRTWGLIGDVCGVAPELGAKGLSVRSYEANVHDPCAEALRDLATFLERACC